MALAHPVADPGFEMRDLLEYCDFKERELKVRVTNREQLALTQIVSKFSTHPKALLQELLEVAIEYCDADSAGISLEEPDGKGGVQFRWIAVAGSFGKYLNGTTPRSFSPCGVCVDQWRPQSYKVTTPYYDFLGVTAAPILDGMLIPWQSISMRGTIWAVSHKSELAFDMNDYSLLQKLADLISAALRHLSKC